jgi:hypothetical protein
VLLLLLAALGFLAAWDLTRLVERLQLVQDPAVALLYAGQHLKVLGLVLAAGLVLGWQPSTSSCRSASAGWWAWWCWC